MNTKPSLSSRAVVFALLLCIPGLRAQENETIYKISPKLRAAAAAGQPLPVFIVLANQPQRDILQRAHEAGAARLRAAHENYRNLVAQPLAAQSALERAGNEVDDAVLAIRRDAAAQIEAAIRPGQDALERRILARGGVNIHRFTTVNMLSATIPADSLDSLEADSDVAAVFPVESPEPSLNISAPALGARAVWATGNSGAGQQVAILDSGIRTNHPAFRGVKIESYVFVTGGVAQAPIPACVADNPLSGEDQFGHGTHVAGIVASGGAGAFTTYIGVAPAVSKVINLKIAG